MTFDQSFLLALLLLVIGSGFLKGNISAQVGALYPPEDEARRTRGFVIFSTGINIGAVAGPLLCGLLAQLYGWHFGFGIAAIFMLLGLATYLYGYRYLPARVERRKFESATRLTATEWRVVVALIAVMIISIFESIAYGQVFNVSSIWIQQHVALDMGGFRIPVPGSNRSIRFSASRACRCCSGSGGNRHCEVASLTNWPRSAPAPFLPRPAT
jgi:Dipeptide/tripeptide permease